MFLTVFTPTYNRAELLKQCFQSLQQQSFVNFEWLIVDDGSTDTTEKVIQDFKRSSNFEIRYFKQNNAGKHIAINKGVEKSKGEFFMILDSDDFLPRDAIELVLCKISQVEDAINVAGVAGRRSYFDNHLIGTEFKGDINCSSIDIRFKYKIKGDLVEVFKTKVLQKFPFPEIKDEKFCPEALVWNRIAQKYTLLYFNKVIYKCKYIEGGLTDKIIEIRMHSPKASMLYYSELSQYKIPIFQKLKAVINFWRFSFCSNQSFQKKLIMVNGFYTLIALPLGYLYHLKDKLNVL